MKFPKLTELNTSRSMIDVFRGYNHNLRIGEGEFYDMTNLTSSDYPVLSPRPKRGVYKSTENFNPSGLIAKDSLGYIEGHEFYLNEYSTEGLNLNMNGNADLSKTSLVSMGAYVIIIMRDSDGNPIDKKWVNTQPKSDEDAFGDIEASVTGNVVYHMCDFDGNVYEYSTTKPTGPKDGDLWMDTSTVPYSLKRYSETNETWVVVSSTYVKITFLGWSGEFPFKEGDGVTIKDSIKSDLNGTMIVHKAGANHIVVTGIVADGSEEDEITIERRMPNMDFIIESENRLWGCRYGVALNGEVVNEIYASKLGDFKNWNCFAGISTDSYVASVGTDGQFTGATTHLGYPLFFKENCMHKIYGNFPANFQIQTTACRGVQKGCSKSLAIVNEVLYYKSRSAICSYDGSLPVEISSALGDESYSNAVAGSLGNKYYVSMLDSANKHHLFVYDTKKGMWHKEDNTKAIDFCSCRGNLYYIEGNAIKSVLEDGEKSKYDVEWMAETGILGTDSPDKKYISRLDVRMSLDVGTYVYFYIQYDSSEEWEHVYTMAGHTLRSFSVPIKPKRCDHLQLRIVGEGNAKIYSICKTIEQGSDI